MSWRLRVLRITLHSELRFWWWILMVLNLLKSLWKTLQDTQRVEIDLAMESSSKHQNIRRMCTPFFKTSRWDYSTIQFEHQLIIRRVRLVLVFRTYFCWITSAYCDVNAEISGVHSSFWGHFGWYLSVELFQRWRHPYAKIFGALELILMKTGTSEITPVSSNPNSLEYPAYRLRQFYTSLAISFHPNIDFY